MKKAMMILLVVIFALSAVLLVACNAKVVKITLKDVPEKVNVGDTIEYEKISIDVEYEDGTTENVKLTAGVTYKPIDTSKYGTQTLTVSYKGASTSAFIKVVPADVNLDSVVVMGVLNTQGYRDYQKAIAEQSEKETEFYNRDVVYTVGNDNGYVFVPSVKYSLDGTIMPSPLPDSNVYTNFKLSIKNGNSWNELSETAQKTYLSNVENNIYYFTKQATNETFKLEVTLSDIYTLISPIPTTVTQIFEVVNGYNVYDAWGLSVLDNKNVKSWATIKSQDPLDWDNGKKLSEFGDVEQIVLHNDIEVTVDYLPDNYFWKENEEASRVGSTSYLGALNSVPDSLKEYLPGSLKEVWLGEDWEKDDNDKEQRGLYVSNGIGISGNCLTISYDSNLSAADKSSKGIYIVYDYKHKKTQTGKQHPESHYSLIMYTHATANGNDEESIKGTRTIKNVYFTGETQKTDDIADPSGIMMLSADITGLEIINTISTQWYCNVQVDGVGQGTLKLEDCKFYESFSQMVFSWGIPTIDVTHCEMKRAGGPLFIIQTRTGTGDDAKNRDSVVTIDSTSNMESWLKGTETWFEINDLPSAIVEQLFTIGTLPSTSLKRNYLNSEGQVNLLGVVIPDPGEVFQNQVAIPGVVNIGETVYSMDDEIFKAILALNAISNTGSTLAQSTLDAIGENKDVSALKAGYEGLVLSPVMPVYKSGTNYGYFDGKKFNQLSQMQQLYLGALQVQATLNDNANKLEAAGQTAQAAGLKALATQWGELAANANLTKVGTYKGATSEWDAGHMAFFVNPGGLNAASPNLKLKHFMVLFGEGAAA